MNFRHVVVGAVTLGALAACTASGSGSITPNPTGASVAPSAAPAMTATVTIKDMKFTPAEVTIKKGGTVTWTNQDTMQHDANPKDGGFTKTALLKTGESGSATFAATGTFNYDCSLHGNMQGKVTVVD